MNSQFPVNGVFKPFFQADMGGNITVYTQSFSD